MATPPDEAGPFALLSKRERVIAARFAEGLTYREIGEARYIAPATVRTHLATIYRKLGVRNKAALVHLVAGSHGIARRGGQDEADALQQDARLTNGGLEAGRIARQAERRHLTVLVCDLADLFQLTQRLEAEELRDLMAAYREACATITTRFGGYAVRAVGQLQVYFGYPSAREDEAARAVRAGLELISAAAELGSRLGHPLELKVGVATGVVVVGDPGNDGAASDPAAVGGALDLAARLQMLAEPGTVILAEATYRLLGGTFDVLALTPMRLEGVSQPIVFFRAIGERRLESRFEARQARAPLPLIRAC